MTFKGVHVHALHDNPRGVHRLSQVGSHAEYFLCINFFQMHACQGSTQLHVLCTEVKIGIFWQFSRFQQKLGAFNASAGASEHSLGYFA